MRNSSVTSKNSFIISVTLQGKSAKKEKNGEKRGGIYSPSSSLCGACLYLCCVLLAWRFPSVA